MYDMQEFDSFRDEELIPIIREENQQLYRVIIERYEKKLLRYAMVFIRDEDTAEDIVQSAFIKAFTNLHGFNVKKIFSSWIYRIVHNEALNYIKKHKREIPIDDVAEVKKMSNDEEPAGDAIDRQKMKHMLRSCLNDLPLNYREPLELYYLEEQSYEEISDILHMPIGTVGTRMNRGKALLKKIYQQRYGHHE